MKPLLAIKHWLVLGVVLAAFTTCFVLTRVLYPEEHREIINALKEVRQLKSRLIEDALRVRTGLIVTYDSLVEISKELTDAVDDLHHKLASLSFPNQPAILRALTDLKKGVLVDLEEVDQFKGANSIVRNSLRYLPIAHEDAIAETASNETRKLVDRIYQNALRFSLEPGNGLQPQLLADSAQLKQMLSGQSSAERRKIFLTHVEHILKYETQIDADLNSFAGKLSFAPLNDLFRAYDEGYALMSAQRLRYQVVMYSLFVLVLATLGYVLAQLRDAFRNLKVMNTQLEVKVSEIAELHAKAESKVSLGKIERNQLRHSVKSLERVLGVIGHELRTPLASLRAMAEYLLGSQDRQAPDYSEFLTAIPQLVDRMSQDVNDLLEVARLNSGASKWSWGEFDVVNVCSAALESVRPLVDHEIISLELEIEPDITVMTGDQAAVRRLLINLLNNSVKNTQQGSIVLGVRSDRANTLRFEVSDSGSGMTRQVGEQLGVAFVLNEGMIGDEHVKGSGLGLAICKGIVAAHGGTMTVMSAPGQGTTVALTMQRNLCSPASTEGAVDIKFLEKGLRTLSAPSLATAK